MSDSVSVGGGGGDKDQPRSADETRRAINPADNENKNRASIRRLHKIGPLFGGGSGSRSSLADGDSPAKRPKKSTIPIRIFARPLPGRSFDGFLDRFGFVRSRRE